MESLTIFLKNNQTMIKRLILLFMLILFIAFVAITLIVVIAKTDANIFWNTINSNEPIIQAILVLATIVGVTLVLIQLSKDKTLKEAEYLIKFNTNLATNRNFMDVYYFCASQTGFITNIKTPLKPDGTILEPDIKIIIEYLDFFEPLFYLIRNKVIHVEKLAGLIEHRFFIVVCNQYVQERVIRPYRSYFGTLNDLNNEMKRNLCKSTHCDYNDLKEYVYKHDLAKIF